MSAGNDLLERTATLLESDPRELIVNAYAASHAARRPSAVMIDHWLDACRSYGEMPEWLSRYCHAVESRHAAGARGWQALQPRDGGNPGPIRRRGVLFLLLLFSMLGLLIVLAHFSGEIMGLGSCIFPPCVER